MTPSDSCTARTSSSGCSPYAYGRFHGPAHWIVAPASRHRRQWIDPRRAGVCSRPASSPQLDRRPRRSRGRRPDRRLVHRVLLGVHADAREVAELALARAHGRRRVALRELDRVEALADRALHVLRRHVLHTHTKHLPFPLYAGSGAILERPSPVTLPTASTPSGSSVGTKTPRASSNSTRPPACASSE